MNNQKGLWTVLIIILVILIIWGIVAAYNRSEVAPVDQGLNTTSTEVNGTSNRGQGGSSNGTVSNKNAPLITLLTPSSGSAGNSITVTGARFTPANNSIRFGGYVVGNVVSNDSIHISFSIPTRVSSCLGSGCTTSSSTVVAPGVYPIVVSNTNGTSNLVTFTVTASKPQ